jgi:putative flippase GtrA
MKTSIKKTAKNTVSGETKLFIRIQIASILGSAADYLVTIMLASGLGFYYLLANLAGNILGGALQFYLSRKWAFPSVGGSVNWQIFRFALVFSGGLVLSAAGVFLLTNYGDLHYVLSKTIVSIFLGVTYNYLLQKKFVFASNDRG